jgi:methionyl aminopeptidase
MRENRKNCDFVDEKKEAILKEIGALSKGVFEKARKEVRSGARLVDAAESIEQFIRDSGYGLAFPINLSSNEQAAHYTPSIDDERVFGKDLVKVDIGIEKEGMLSDCAITIDLTGENMELVEAAHEALKNAISAVKAGVKVCEIGREIGRTIESFGLLPISNLGGHGVGENDLHAEPFIPNYDNGDDTALEEGMVIAIEPFATDGKGTVVSGDSLEIYSLVNDLQVRSKEARMALAEIREKYPKNPFAARWLLKAVGSRFGVYAGLNELRRAGVLEVHPVLVEASGGMVAQAEAELIVQKDGCAVLTEV